MVKKKLNARQRDIERLAKGYQSSLEALNPEYESVMQKKASAVSDFEKQSQDFQKRLKEYQKSLAAYKAYPFESEKIRGSYEPYGKTYEWGYVIDGNWFSEKNLPEGYVPEKEYGEYALKRKSPPKFQDKPPKVADTTAFDTELQAIETKRKTLGEGFEREKAERSASRLRAVSQRSRERPMLSKGASLNG